tara:strand:- start:6512 stop:7942 length:1431 start_codon:yes stop_codon:yes gene_type:complete
MNKNFKNLALYFTANIIPQLLTFILLPLYGRVLSLEEYGTIGLLEVVSYIAIATITLSLERAAIRFYSSCNSEQEIKTIYGAIFYGALAIGLLILTIGGGVYISIPVSYVSNIVTLGMIIVLSIFMKSLFLIICRYFQAKQCASMFFALQMGRVCIEFSLIIYFVAFLKLGVEGYVYALLLTSIITVPVLFITVWRHFSINFNRQQFYRVLKYSVPFVPTIMSAWVFNMFGRVAVEIVEGSDAVGLYSMAYKLASAGILIVTAIQMAYTPIFLELTKDKEFGKEKINNYTMLINKTLLLGFAIMAFVFSEYIELLSGEKYAGISTIGILFLLTFYASSVMSVTSNLIYAEQEKTAQHMRIYLVFSVVAFIVISISAYFFGMYGAVVGQLIVVFSLYYVHVKEAQKLKNILIPSIQAIILSSLGIGIFGLVGEIGYIFLLESLWLLIIAKVSLALFVCFFLFKKEIVSFVKYQKFKS